MAVAISLLSVLGCHFVTEIFQICQIVQILRVIQSYQFFCTVNLCHLAKKGKMRRKKGNSAQNSAQPYALILRWISADERNRGIFLSTFPARVRARVSVLDTFLSVSEKKRPADRAQAAL